MKTLITAVEEWIDDRVWKASRVAEHEAQFDANEQKLNVLHEKVAELERRVMELSDPVDEALYISFDELVERVDTLESEMYEVEKTTEDIPDSYSIEVMIDDALETKVMDAVKEELDATEFKVTIER
jgi:peptidoglycan hydrolase CwlO-like protein